MVMPDEGYIKYHCRWIQAEPMEMEVVKELCYWRGRLFAAGIIGADSNGVGFGNISIRWDQGCIISGTQTGGIETIGPEHFTKVTQVDLAANSLVCSGPIQASSEAMTHAAIYRCNAAVQAVIHVHDRARWMQLLHIAPTTDASVPYGTPEMAWEIERLFRKQSLESRGMIAMAGHTDGIIAFGRNLQEAGSLLVEG
ncbi:MAG: class II aldolase/adducin family protein [Armatimonadetes bacterium]|nr:class II aldolase/adducin family protein [Armatimonadota bacterium]